MKQYKYKEWDLHPDWDGEKDGWDFQDRTYVDLDGNLITGILEGFYRFGSLPSDHQDNCQEVSNGKTTGRK